MDAVRTAAKAATSADDALVRRARTGDAAAFAELVDTRIDRCYRLAWSVLSNDADAADATQDALVSAWRQLPRLRDPAAFDGWLNRIVANAALMARRHRVRLREVSVQPAYPGDEATTRTATGRARQDGSGCGRRQRCDLTRLRPPATRINRTLAVAVAALLVITGCSTGQRTDSVASGPSPRRLPLRRQ